MGTKIGHHAPPKEVRTDKLDHWPIESEKKLDVRIQVAMVLLL